MTRSTAASLSSSFIPNAIQQTRIQQNSDNLEDLNDFHMHNNNNTEEIINFDQINTIYSTTYNSQSADQFRQYLLQSLRNKHYVDEFDTFSFHMEEEYSLEYLMNLGLSARIVDILKKPIIIIEE